MSKLINTIYTHIITKPKYNAMKNSYETAIKTLVERTNERDAANKTIKILKKKFDETIEKLLEENISLKAEIKELKRKGKKNVSNTNKRNTKLPRETQNN